jgi:hypothetical protein
MNQTSVSNVIKKSSETLIQNLFSKWENFLLGLS